MSIETYQFNLPITPGAIPPVLHLSQYDSGRTFTAVLRDDQGVPFELAASSTAVIKGRNAAGIAWQQDCTVSGANVTFTPSGAATDQFGVMPVTIEITESEEIISPLCVVFHIQKAGYTNEEAVLSPDFETAIQAAVAQAIAEGGLGFSDEFKEALLACFNGVAWATTGGQALVDDLEAALYPEVHLVSITAAYDQDHPIYVTDSQETVDATIMLDLAVTANYSDGTSEAVDGYTLSGSLTAGQNTYTVTFQDKTATISVLILANTWLYHFNETLTSSGTRDFGFSGTANYTEGVDGKAYWHKVTTEGTQSTDQYGIKAIGFSVIPKMTGDFTVSLWHKAFTNLRGHPLSFYKPESGTISSSDIKVPSSVASGWTLGTTPSTMSKGYTGIALQYASQTLEVLIYGTDGTVVRTKLTLPSGTDTTNWHHYAITRKDGVLRFFFDGAIIWSLAYSAPIAVPDQIAIGNGFNASDATALVSTSYGDAVDDLYIGETCLFDDMFDPSSITY